MLTKRFFTPIFVAGLVAIILGAASAQIFVDYASTKARTETVARDIAMVGEVQIRSTVKQAHAMLSIVADKVMEDGGMQNFLEESHWEVLHSACDKIIGCVSIAMVDLDGSVRALSNTPDKPSFHAGDREYFRVTKSTMKPYVGPAVVSRLPNSPILFSLAIPVIGNRGELLGVISAGMDTSHFTDFHQLLGFNVAPLLTVFKANGDLVARSLDMRGNVGKSNANGQLFTEQLPRAASGIYESVSKLDGASRIAAYRSLPDLDLVIWVGIEPASSLAAWKSRSAWTVGTSSVSLVLVLALLSWARRLSRRAAHSSVTISHLDKVLMTDSLTGVANRRQFDRSMQQHWYQGLAENTPCSVLMIDVDYFKRYNDRYGHVAGDECLRMVARALSREMHRDGDVVARYGGEEFAAVMEASLDGAMQVAERLRQAIAALEIPVAEGEAARQVTVSIGVASTSCGDFASAQSLIEAADMALYEAKHNGRNRCAASDGESASLALSKIQPPARAD